MERLRGIAGTAFTMMSQEGCQVGRVVREVGSTLCATHKDGEGIYAYFGRRQKVEIAGVLEEIAQKGVPAEVGAGGNLGNELAYGNHRSAFKHRGEVLKKAATDAAMGKTIVFPATQAHEMKELRISPVGVVEEKEKLRVIHNLTFGRQANAREGGGGGTRCVS